MTKILAFSGSSRTASYNQKLVNIAAQGAQTAGADVTVINLADFPMPIFCEDYEAEHGMPESAQQLKALIQSHDGLLIASPEYNSSYTALLKNSIDWVTRPGPTDALKGNPLSGKAASIMACSGGALGGYRGLVVLRMLLGNLGVTVHPNQRALGKIHEAFDENAQLANPKQQEGVMHLGKQVVQLASQLKG